MTHAIRSPMDGVLGRPACCSNRISIATSVCWPEVIQSSGEIAALLRLVNDFPRLLQHRGGQDRVP
jgi:hypothetical protein